MGPFFCYFGGKWRAAPRYPSPRYDTIVEPFAGAAGYATRYAQRRVVIVERDPLIAALWRYLISVPSHEIRRLPLVCPGQTTDDLLCAEEARWLIGFWLNKGASRPRKRASSWGLSGKTLIWCDRVRERIAQQVDHIRHWTVIEGDYTLAPAVAATWFVDPPYVGMGHLYAVHDLDYSALGDWCRGLRGQVMVCEQSGADWLPFSPFRRIQTNPSRRGRQHSEEVIWPSLTEVQVPLLS